MPTHTVPNNSPENIPILPESLWSSWKLFPVATRGKNPLIELQGQVIDLNVQLREINGSNKQIAADIHSMEQHALPVVTSHPPAIPPKLKPSVPQPPSNLTLNKSDTDLLKPAPESVTGNYGNIYGLSVSQTTQDSTRADAPNKIEVVVQSNRDRPSLKLLLTCDGPIVDGTVGIAGGLTQMTMMTGGGVVKSDPRLYAYFYGSASPPFGPSHPIVFNLWSINPITCTRVDTY